MAHPAHRVQRVRRARHRRRSWRSILPTWRDARAVLVGVAIGLAAFTLIALTAVASLSAIAQGSRRVLPGVTVAGVSLGGMRPEEAAQAIDAAWVSGQTTLLLSDGEHNWQVAPSQFGFALDAPATAQRALEAGRGQGLLALYRTLLDGVAVAPVVTLDPAQARLALETWALTVNQPAQDATVRIENGQAVAVPGVPGRTLNVEATLAALSIDPGAVLHGGSLPLVLTPVQPRIADASSALVEAQALLDAPLTLTAYDPITDEDFAWTASPEVIAAWLQVQATADGAHVVVSEEALAAYLDSLDEGLGSQRRLDPSASAASVLEALRDNTPAMLALTYHPTTYTVQPGDTLVRIAWKVGMPLWRVQAANPGLNPDTLSVGQTLTIPAKTDLLPLPVVPGKRIVVNITDQRLRVYENRQLIREFVISTGIDRSPTQPGVFQVQTHELNAYASLWDLWMPHFMGIYEAWPGFMNGFHGLPTLSGGGVLWADVLGRPASFGCIILDLDDAEWLYTWAEDGVVAEIEE